MRCYESMRESKIMCGGFDGRGEGEGVSLPETNKREQSTETKEAVRYHERKKKHHGMEL